MNFVDEAQVCGDNLDRLRWSEKHQQAIEFGLPSLQLSSHEYSNIGQAAQTADEIFYLNIQIIMLCLKS